MNHKQTYHQSNDPSPEEIMDYCRFFQKGWTQEEERRRLELARVKQPYLVQIVESPFLPEKLDYIGNKKAKND